MWGSEAPRPRASSGSSGKIHASESPPDTTRPHARVLSRRCAAHFAPPPSPSSSSGTASSAPPSYSPPPEGGASYVPSYVPYVSHKLRLRVPLRLFTCPFTKLYESHTSPTPYVPYVSRTCPVRVPYVSRTCPVRVPYVSRTCPVHLRLLYLYWCYLHTPNTHAHARTCTTTSFTYQQPQTTRQCGTTPATAGAPSSV